MHAGKSNLKTDMEMLGKQPSSEDRHCPHPVCIGSTWVKVGEVHIADDCTCVWAQLEVEYTVSALCSVMVCPGKWIGMLPDQPDCSLSASGRRRRRSVLCGRAAGLPCEVMPLSRGNTVPFRAAVKRVAFGDGCGFLRCVELTPMSVFRSRRAGASALRRDRTRSWRGAGAVCELRIAARPAIKREADGDERDRLLRSAHPV